MKAKCEAEMLVEGLKQGYTLSKILLHRELIEIRSSLASVFLYNVRCNLVSCQYELISCYVLLVETLSRERFHWVKTL